MEIKRQNTLTITTTFQEMFYEFLDSIKGELYAGVTTWEDVQRELHALRKQDCEYVRRMIDTELSSLISYEAQLAIDQSSVDTEVTLQVLDCNGICVLTKKI